MAGKTSVSKQASILSLTRKQEAVRVEGTPVPRGRIGEAKVPAKYQKMSFLTRLKLGILYNLAGTSASIAHC